jgi:hypothetical protein
LITLVIPRHDAFFIDDYPPFHNLPDLGYRIRQQGRKGADDGRNSPGGSVRVDTLHRERPVPLPAVRKVPYTNLYGNPAADFFVILFHQLNIAMIMQRNM